jgi:acetyl-CoA carboxylase carboxyl transferase subunit alpha
MFLAIASPCPLSSASKPGKAPGVSMKVPLIVIIIGEGASGGALGIGLSDRILCLKNTWYSVISPEGCASILFRDANRASDAANAMKVTSKDLLDMKIVDEIIDEPNGAAHIDPLSASNELKKIILRVYDEIKINSTEDLIIKRMEKYNSIGEWST